MISPRRSARSDDIEADADIDDERELTAEEEAELAELESMTPEQLQAELWALMTPPDDLPDRIDERVREQMLGRDTMLTVLDLFGLGWRTTKLVVAPEDDHEV